MGTNIPSGEDYVSDLPQSILECILAKLPLRDAVRTSILSSKWRYKWATLTQLVFNDECVSGTRDMELDETNFIKFVSRFLLLHDGPIHSFRLCTYFLDTSNDVEQWLLFLSRKDIRELSIALGEGIEFFVPPSHLYSCKKLVRLELVKCELYPPSSIKGFPCLKQLHLHGVIIAPYAVENFFSSCPLLESLTYIDFKTLELTICAPNLKYLTLDGEFEDIFLKNTPMLVAISVAMNLPYKSAGHLGQSSSCNIDKFFGGVPSLERLTGDIDFTKYMSVGNTLGKTQMTYDQLKVIELYHVSFEDMKEIMVVLRLILNAPNLQELQISGPLYPSSATEAPDLGFWEEELPYDCTLHQLKMVKMTKMSGIPHELAFIGFLLKNSPVLKSMSITPWASKGILSLSIELLRLRRASAEAEIIFVQNHV